MILKIKIEIEITSYKGKVLKKQVIKEKLQEDAKNSNFEIQRVPFLWNL